MTETITLSRRDVAQAAWRLFLIARNEARAGYAATAKGAADRARPLLIALRDSVTETDIDAEEARLLYDTAVRELNGETVAREEG